MYNVYIYIYIYPCILYISHKPQSHLITLPLRKLKPLRRLLKRPFLWPVPTNQLGIDTANDNPENCGSSSIDAFSTINHLARVPPWLWNPQENLLETPRKLQHLPLRVTKALAQLYELANFIIAAVLYVSPITVLHDYIPGLYRYYAGFGGRWLEISWGFLVSPSFSILLFAQEVEPFGWNMVVVLHDQWWYSAEKLFIFSWFHFPSSKSGKTDQINHIFLFHLRFTYHLTQTSKNSRIFFQCSTCTRRWENYSGEDH